MLLQATLNGPYTKADHPGIPESVEELVEDAMACVAAGARAFHIHPRDTDRCERLNADVVDQGRIYREGGVRGSGRCDHR